LHWEPPNEKAQEELAQAVDGALKDKAPGNSAGRRVWEGTKLPL